MKIKIIGNEKGAKEAVKQNAIAIIVDTLRASTTIPILMQKGIDTLYIAKDVEATRIAAKKFNSLLIGERECKKLPGFDYGNSPVEINKLSKIKKSIATFTSSTGARRVIEAIGSKIIIIGSPINAKAVAKKTIEFSKQFGINQIIIVPAFTHGNIIDNKTTEDQVGSLLIANEFQKEGIKLEDTIEKEIQYLTRRIEQDSLYNILLATEHGQKLVSLNFEEDIRFCSQKNITTQVPFSKNKVINLKNDFKVVKFQK